MNDMMETTTLQRTFEDENPYEEFEDE